jgi:hypothetical protein
MPNSTNGLVSPEPLPQGITLLLSRLLCVCSSIHFCAADPSLSASMILESQERVAEASSSVSSRDISLPAAAQALDSKTDITAPSEASLAVSNATVDTKSDGSLEQYPFLSVLQPDGSVPELSVEQTAESAAEQFMKLWNQVPFCMLLFFRVMCACAWRGRERKAI